MKRDFSNDNISKVKQYLKSAYNSTDNDYRKTYANQSVPDEHTNLKYNTLSVGSDANSHIQSIRNRLDTALSVISTFYSGIDNTSLQIYAKANNIIGILDEINTSMEKIDDVLKGNNKSKYSGNAITPDDIRKAGIDEAKCDSFKLNYYKDFLDSSDAVNKYIEEMKALKSKGELLSPEDIVKLKAVYNWYLKNGNNLSADDLRRFVDVFELLGNDDLTDKMLDGFMKNDDAVKLYLADMKVLSKELDGKLPPEDYEKLKKIYDWYRDLRFDSNNNDNILNISDQALKNGIDVFELLYPNAKTTTDNFFKNALNDPDPIVQKNILRIKFAIYTAPREYRDIILHYMPSLHLGSYKESKVTGDWYAGVGIPHYKGLPAGNFIFTDLTKDYSNDTYNGPYGSFFHEFGHGIDDVSTPFLNSSTRFTHLLKKDFEKSIDDFIKKYNSDPSKKPLTPKEAAELKKYLFSSKNNNVVVDSRYPDSYVNPLPKSWSPAQKDAYNELRKHYGYALDTVDSNNKRTYAGGSSLDPSFGNTSTGSINGDMFGAMTNNKIGLSPGGHPVTYAPYALIFPDSVKNAGMLQASYDTYPYWKIPGISGMEFFAEAFKYGVQQTDTKPTKKVFGKTYDAYEKRIKEIYDGIPHINI